MIADWRTRWGKTLILAAIMWVLVVGFWPWPFTLIPLSSKIE